MQLTISSKGWVVIPADLRKKYDLKPGDKVNVVDYGGVLSLVPVLDDPIRDGLGLLKGCDSLMDALLEDRCADAARDERKWGGSDPRT